MSGRAAPAQRSLTVAAPDGRELHVNDVGDPSWPVVVHHHGTPGCAMLPPSAMADAAERGLRLVSYDRPGYGGSTRLPGRAVAHAAADVAAIAEHLGIDRFATTGASGGGPHTLACAALLPDRVVACASIAGSAPFDAEGLDFFEGMGELNAEELEIVRQGPEAHLAWLSELSTEMRDATPEQLGESLASLLSPVDREALTGDVAEHLHASFNEATRHGAEGWSDESLSGYEPWGFNVASIRVPVGIWHGAQDRFVPIGHGRWLSERIPGCEAHFSDDLGHVSLIEQSVPDVHAWLAEQF